MDDEKIKDLFFERSEEAIKETEAKYGRYLYTIAFNILSDDESSRECLNDTLLQAWNAIPPARPQVLRAFLGKIARNLSLKRLEFENAKKRGGGQIVAIMEELGDLSDGGAEPDRIVDRIALSDSLRSFLHGLRQIDRMVFMKRYWLFMSINEIASDMGLSSSNVRVILHRTREKLREKLTEEGFEI